jgi:DNA-binding HxlR family transcriptional regulator
VFERLQKPRIDSDRRTSALRFGDVRVQALLIVLLWLRLLPTGFRNRELRQQVAGIVSRSEDKYTASQMTYDLRRLCDHGLIERVPRTHTYRLTDEGMRIALVLTRGMQHVIRPALATALDPAEPESTRLGRAVRALDGEIEHLWRQTELAA